MRYNNITPEQITNELYNIFSDDRRAAQYLTGSHAQYLGVLGWAGPMSPENRAAFLSAFGAEQVAKAEQEARARVAEYRAAVAASTYHRNEIAADAAELVDDVPAVGSFVWAVTSWLKGEGGPSGELEHLEEYDHRKEYGHIARVLVEVAAVEHVSPAEFLTTETAYSIAARHQEDGGSRYDENDPRDLKGRPMAWAVGVVVECGGRWYIIDSEGYNYSRYLLFPADFRAVYRAELSAITEAREAREAAERAEAQRQAEARRAEYLARCAKWSPLMVDVTPLLDAERAAYGTREKSQIRKASAKLAAARRRNILAMVSAIYPGVKFSVRKWDGWGGSYELSWTDGPTEDTLKQTAGLKLFERSRDTFDGMTDCAGVECAEFVEFADKYLGCHGEIRLNRTTSEEHRAEIRARILAAVPGIPTEGRITDNGQQSAICAMFRHIYASYIVDNLERYGLADAVAYIARCTDATPAPAPEPDPTGTDGTPSDGSTGADYGTSEKSPISEKPAAGLQLVDIAGGGVAVTSDSRATYKARKEIKSHGATWNKAAKQWEAYDPAAVASLREWFGVTVQDATPEASAPADELPAPPALVSYDPAEPVERAEFHTFDEVAPTAPTDGNHPATEETPTDAPTPSDGATGAAYGDFQKSQISINPGEVYKTAKADRYIIILSDDGEKLSTTDAIRGRFSGNIDTSDKDRFLSCLDAGSIIKADASQLPPVTDVHAWREGLENGYGKAFEIRTELIYTAADAMTEAEKADTAARMGFRLPLDPFAVLQVAALHKWNASRGNYRHCAALEWLVTQQDEPTAFKMNAGAYPVIFADYARRI